MSLIYIDFVLFWAAKIDFWRKSEGAEQKKCIETYKICRISESQKKI